MEHSEPTKSLAQLARESGRYPVEAFDFVREGLQFIIGQCSEEAECHQHVSGEQLCWGLRDAALRRWGFLAPTVLRSWNITTTRDFGRIVFAMVETGWMAKNDEDAIDDFDDVYDFETALDHELNVD